MSKLILTLALFLLSANIVVNAQATKTGQEAILLHRAQAYEREGRLEQANALYTQVLSTAGKSCDVLERRGGNFYALGQYKKALDDASASVSLCPSRDAYLRRSIVLTKLGQFEAALADTNRCLTPGIAERVQYVLLRRCIDSMLCGHVDDARKDADTALTIAPRSVLSLEICSLANALCKKESDAISNLAQFSYAKLHSTSEHYKMQQSSQYNDWPLTKLHSAAELQSPQYQAQYKFWQESDWRQGVMINSEKGQLIARLEREPHFGLSPAQRCFALAIIYFYQRDYDKAVAQASSCASGDRRLYCDLLSCYCHIMKKNFPEAKSVLDSLTLQFPDSQLVLDTVDLYHYAADTRQASIAQMKALLVNNPKNAAALFELAKIHHDLSDLEESLKYCDLSLQLKPKDTRLLLMKANILTGQQKYADALQCLAMLLAEDKKNGPAYLARAAIYTQQGRWTDAVGDLTAAIALKYDLSKSYKARAACYATLKKFDLARQDLSLVQLINREYEAVGKDN